MWHEARKQERLIRGMIVDYRRRAERRKDFYEKIKAEPTQFLQLHGRQCKIHLDPAIAIAGEGPAIMMPWQGDTTNMIDRFDVRAHLDYIPEVKNKDIPPEELEQEERQCNYERYRILAQNAFLGIGEDKFLQQLAIEEQFGVTIEEKEAQKERLHEKKGTGAAIGYNYNDPGAQPSYSNGPESKNMVQEDSDDDSDLDIIDVDLSIDVNKMEASQAHELNAVGPQYGMAGCDLFSFLTGDADDAEHQKQLLREEKEKAMFSGRKSRRERRAHRDKKLATRVMSPPSYAAPRAPSRSRSRSRSLTRSPEPDASTSIQFITSFGDDDDQPSIPSKPLYADKVKQNLKKKELLYSDVARLAKSRSPKSNDRRNYRQIGPHRPTSVSKSRSRSRSRSKPRIWKKTRSKSRSYSRSRSNSSRSRSKSNSYSPRRRSISRSRSGSRSNNYGNNRSRSPQNNSSKGYAKHTDSRSMLHESNDKGGVNKVIPRYYGRRKEDKSSSELSLDSDSSGSSDEEKNETAVSNKLNTNQNQLRLSGSSSKGPSRETLTLKEKLKRKMQAQIARQLRADKKAEAERLERESRRQARRDEEMRELAIKLRRKQREIRHRQYRRSSGDDSDRSRSGSPSRESQLKKKEPSRSKSKSPELPRPQKSPVRETKQDTSVRSKNFNLENYSRKRPDNSEHYRNERKIDEDRSFFKHDRHSKHERYDNRSERDYGDRYDGRSEREYGERFESRSEHQQRWEHQDNYHSRGQRRPFGHRGGYREHSRYGHDQSYRDGPSGWSSRKDFRDSYDRESTDEYSRGKVKLVDY